MNNLFEELKAEYDRRINDQNLEEDPLRIPWVKAANDLINRVASRPHDAQSMEVTFNETTKTSLEIGGDVSVIPQIVKFLGKFRGEKSKGSSVTYSLRMPTPRDLADYCAIMVDTLVQLKLVSHVFVLVDDVDLLETYVNPPQNGRIERSILADVLTEFHQTPGADVVLTARNWYANTKKEFQRLVDLTQGDPMTEVNLVEIHDKRFQEFAKPGMPKNFLNRNALLDAAKDIREGLPGVFLQHMDTAFHKYQEIDDWGEKGYEWYLGVFDENWKRHREKHPAAAKAIEQAVVRGEFTVDVTESNPFHQTFFDGEFVFQSYYQETTYFMDKLVHKVIKRNQQDDSGAKAE